MNYPRRTWDDIKAMTAFGTLWFIHRRTHSKLMCYRVKRREDKLFVDKAERKTFVQQKGVTIEEGDILTFINGEKYPGIIKMKDSQACLNSPTTAITSSIPS